MAVPNSPQSISVDPGGLGEIVSLLDGLPNDLLDVVSLLQTWVPAASESIGAPGLRAALETFLQQWKNALFASANGLADTNRALSDAITQYVQTDQANARQVKNAAG
jgi:hypothetical protein